MTLAMVFLGKTYGISAMAGAFLADAIDTYDKYVYNYAECGTDEDIAVNLKKQLGDKISIEDQRNPSFDIFQRKKQLSLHRGKQQPSPFDTS